VYRNERLPGKSNHPGTVLERTIANNPKLLEILVHILDLLETPVSTVVPGKMKLVPVIGRTRIGWEGTATCPCPIAS